MERRDERLSGRTKTKYLGLEEGRGMSAMAPLKARPTLIQTLGPSLELIMH